MDGLGVERVSGPANSWHFKACAFLFQGDSIALCSIPRKTHQGVGPSGLLPARVIETLRRDDLDPARWERP